MIFVHRLVLTMQVPMYSLWGFCLLPGWLPNSSRHCTLMGFVATTEGALRPRAYFSPYGLIHSLQASYYLLLVFMHDCVVLTSHASAPVPTLSFYPLLAIYPIGFRPAPLWVSW